MKPAVGYLSTPLVVNVIIFSGRLRVNGVFEEISGQIFERHKNITNDFENVATQESGKEMADHTTPIYIYTYIYIFYIAAGRSNDIPF